MAKRHVTKPKKAKPRKVRTVQTIQKPAPKPEAKAEPWQPIDTAPVLTPVKIRVGGKTVDAILDGHWYACVDGKPVIDQIIHDPTDWMPLKK